jgi:hypothetical protein
MDLRIDVEESARTDKGALTRIEMGYSILGDRQDVGQVDEDRQSS